MSAGPRRWSNWSGTESCSPASVVRPRSVTELREVVATASRHQLRVRAIGSGHSFTGAAVAPDIQVDLSRLNRIVAIDHPAGRVTVEAGVRLARLNALLAHSGLALTNLGDVDRQTLAGAISTGTHGTGARFAGLAAQVVSLDLVLGDGSLRSCSADQEPDLFDAARVSVGALGIIVRLTLQTVPAFRLHAIERPMPLAEVLSGLDDWVGSHDHVEFYWFPHTERALTKTNDRLARDAVSALPRLARWRRLLDDEVLSNGVFGATNLACSVAPGLTPAVNRLAVRALAGREYVDASYRVFVSSRRVRFVESEYAVPRAALVPVLGQLRQWVETHDQRLPFPVEVRFAARDDIWLSTAYQRDTAYLAVHQYHRLPKDPYFAAFEAIALAHEGRPHWGKLHSLGARELAGRYPRFAEFTAMRGRLDPDRRFANPYTTKVFGI